MVPLTWSLISVSFTRTFCPPGTSPTLPNYFEAHFEGLLNTLQHERKQAEPVAPPTSMNTFPPSKRSHLSHLPLALGSGRTYLKPGHCKVPVKTHPSPRWATLSPKQGGSSCMLHIHPAQQSQGCTPSSSWTEARDCHSRERGKLPPRHRVVVLRPSATDPAALWSSVSSLAVGKG